MIQKQTLTHWLRQLEHIGHGRLLRLLCAGVILWGMFVPIAKFMADYNEYQLSDATRALIGRANPNLSAKFSYDDAASKWQFNKDGMAVQANTLAAAQGTDAGGVASALQQLRAQIGGGGKHDDSLYSVDLPADASKGVTYYDNDSQLSFTMTPEFKVSTGREWQGRLIYPASDRTQLVYTAKTNGLKEDIILNHNVGDSLTYSYKLNLPSTLEARLQDDGSVGVFSADASLYGNISFSSSEDEARVLDARETAPKTHLVFAIPAPVIKDSKGNQSTGVFTLGDGVLTVQAKGLSQLSYPVTVDPSVVITSSSDFASGNNEGGIDYGTPGQITDTTPSGATVGSWTTSGTTLGSATNAFNAVSYKGYLYNVGGYTSSLSILVQRLNLNTDGSVASETTTGTTSTQWGQAIAYNGYLYAIGGGSSSASNGVAYAPLSPTTGAVGTWQNTSTLNIPRRVFAAAAYNGYLYVIGGDSAGNIASVEYAPVHGDGTLGTWMTTTSFSGSGRKGLTAAAYNGYLYIAGGANTSYLNTTEYAPINSNGTVGAWVTGTSFTTARYTHAMAVYNGYLYIAGGSSDGGATGYNDVQYAPIMANGALGSWQSTTSFTTGRANFSLVAYGGRLYLMGGSTGGSSPTMSDIQYTKISTGGAISSFANSATTFTTPRALICSIAYNGYLYAIGGSTNDSGTGNVATLQYAALDSQTGQTGTWAPATSLPEPRGSAGCAVANGYLYVVGGSDTVSGTVNFLDSTRYIAINTDGTLAAAWSNGTTMPYSAFNANAFTYNNVLYVLGNPDGGAGQDTFHASLNPSTGAIGTWVDDGASGNRPSDGAARGYAQVGKYLYAFGGVNGSLLSSVQYATIQSDGSVSAWQSTASLNTGIAYTKGTTVNGCIYSVGGENASGTSMANVQYACPNADGTISAWYNAANLPAATTDIGVTSYRGYIYGVGGWTTSSSNTTLMTQVNNGGFGTSGAYSTTTSFTTARSLLGSVAYNGCLYVLGGMNGANYYSDVQYAPLNKNGTVGTWNTTTPLNGTGTAGMAVTVYNGYLYVLGGISVGGFKLSDVQYAPINSDGSIGTWSATTSLTTARTALAAVAHNGYLYTLGGASTGSFCGCAVFLNTVQYAPINSDGSIGTWSATTSFATGESALGTFLYGDFLYVVGGYTGGTTYLNTVQYAPINSDGSIGTWSATTSFTTARSALQVVALNGYVYILGGNNGSGYLNDVQYAPINSDGSIGTWSATTSFTTARSSFGAAAYNGYLYIAGGGGASSSYLNDVQYAPLNSIARIAHYSKLLSLSGVVNSMNVYYNGSFNEDTKVRLETAGSNGLLGNSSTPSVGGGTDPGNTCTAASTNYAWISITLDDSHRGVFGGDGGNSNITDITVYYAGSSRPTTPLRLHGGKWFQNQVLQPLDTCGS